MDDLGERARMSPRRWLGLGVVLGAAAVLVAFALPIHVTPGNGSLRCADSFFAGGLHYDDSEGLGRMCAAAARHRLCNAGLLGIGAMAAVASLALKRRRWRIAGLLGGSLSALLGLLGVFENLMG